MQNWTKISSSPLLNAASSARWNARIVLVTYKTRMTRTSDKSVAADDVDGTNVQHEERFSQLGGGGAHL